MAGTLLIVNTLWGMPQTLVSLIMVKDSGASLQVVKKVVREHVKPGSIIIAPLHFQQYLDYHGRWRLVDNDVIEGLSDSFKYMIQTRYKIIDGKIEGLRPVQKSTRSKSESGMLMAMSHHVKRKLNMWEFMPSNNGKLPEKLLSELDRLNSSDNGIYVLGSAQKIKEKLSIPVPGRVGAA